MKIKPRLIIVTTPELAPATLLYRWRHPTVELIYDLQENYPRNLLFHHRRFGQLRRILAALVEFWEKQLVKRCRLVWVAEEGYYKEKPWLDAHSAVLLQNKVIAADFTLRPTASLPKDLRIIYTGTISRWYGIWDAIRFVNRLRQQHEGEVLLHIAGHVSEPEAFLQLQKLAHEQSWISTDISQAPVPHRRLIDAMRRADIGIVSHQLIPSIENCFPTRIWEYMASGLPFFLQNHQSWVSYCQPWQCAIPVDFSQEDWPVQSIITELYSRPFYENGVPDSIYWDEHYFIPTLKPGVTYPATIHSE